MLIIDYDPKDKTEFIYGSRKTLMKIKYNHVALPVLIKVGTKHFINISYDRYLNLFRKKYKKRTIFKIFSNL